MNYLKVLRVIAITKKMNFIYLIFLMILSGCATIFNGTDQSILITPSSSSSPIPNKVKVIVSDGSNTFKTTIPNTVHVMHNINGVSIITNDKRYEHDRTVIGKSIAKTTFLNILFVLPLVTIPFAALGFTVDIISGAIWKYPTTVTVSATLKEKN